MVILALDTTTRAGSAALMRGEEVVDVQASDAARPQAERLPGVLKRTFAEGHEIGNHTYSHPNLANISLQRTRLELNATQRLFARAASGRPCGGVAGRSSRALEAASRASAVSPA